MYIYILAFMLKKFFLHKYKTICKNYRKKDLILLKYLLYMVYVI